MAHIPIATLYKSHSRRPSRDNSIRFNSPKHNGLTYMPYGLERCDVTPAMQHFSPQAHHVQILKGKLEAKK